jgi:hypothetical protein
MKIQNQMSSLKPQRQASSQLDGWRQPPPRLEPLPGQAGLFEYRPRIEPTGQGELFDTGRDLPGVDEGAQRLLWDIDN